MSDRFWADLTDYVLDGYRGEAFPCCGLERFGPCPVCGRRYADRMGVRVWRWRHFRRDRGVLVPRGRPVLWGARRRDHQLALARPAPIDVYWMFSSRDRASYLYELGLEFAKGRPSSFAVLTGITS